MANVCGLFSTGEKIYSIAGMATLLGITYPTAYKMIVKDKEIPFGKAGRQYRILESNIRAFLNGEKGRKRVPEVQGLS